MIDQNIFTEVELEDFIISIDRSCTPEEKQLTGGWSFTIEYADQIAGDGQYNTPTAALRAAVVFAQKHFGIKISDNSLR